MGMFDQWQNFTDHFKEGEEFRLEDAKTQQMNTAEYGEQTAALLKVNGEWYSLFGIAIVAQIQRMENGDLPATVRVERTRNKNNQAMKILVPAGQEVPEQVSAPSKNEDDDIPF